MASGAANGTAANGAGITVDGASATITYNSTGDSWDFNKDIDVAGTVTANNTAEGDTYFTGGTANSRLLNVFTSTHGSSANAGHNFKVASGELSPPMISNPIFKKS